MNKKEKVHLSYGLGLVGLGLALLGAAIDVLLEYKDIGTAIFYIGWMVLIAGMLVGFASSREKRQPKSPKP